jgi:hypothetical protein
MGPNRDSSVHCARPPPLKTVTQARLRATLAVRTVIAATTSAAASTPDVDPAPIHAGELEVEDEEDNARRDNDLLNNPAVPDYEKILFAPDDRYAFKNKADHDHALVMVNEVLQTKEEESEAAWLAKKVINPIRRLGKSCSATCRARPAIYGSDRKPGAQPVRQGMRCFTAEETAEITKQVDKMLRAEVIAIPFLLVASCRHARKTGLFALRLICVS